MVSLKRIEAANGLNVTTDTLRNWELNGLITIKRRENGYRVYDASDMARLNIIRTLRCANYSLSAILRLLNKHDRNCDIPVEEVLNTPEANEDIVSVCDRLIMSLESTRSDAVKIQNMLKDINLMYM